MLKNKIISFVLTFALVFSLAAIIPIGKVSAVTKTPVKNVSKSIIKADTVSDDFISSLQGFTLSVINPWDNAPPGTPIYEQDNAVKTTVESKYNVKIDEKGLITNYNQAVASSLAAGKPLAHILMVQSFDFYSYFNKNYFARLNIPMSISGVT